LSETSVLVTTVVVVVFCSVLTLGTLGAVWLWAVVLAACAGIAAGPLIRQIRDLQAVRAQLGLEAAALGEACERMASDHAATTAELVDEVQRLRDRLLTAERVAAESSVRLQRYDLIQRPGSFEIELFCEACNAWRPSGVLSTWEHFKRDEPFVAAEGRFILSCGHEVRADNYNARAGAKVAPTVRRLTPPGVRAVRGPAADGGSGPVALSG
jgi:hypothetical protein